MCPGSEGCEEVVEREQLLCISGEGMGVVQTPRARKLNWRDGFNSLAARQLIPQSISRAAVLCLDNGHCRISHTLPHTKNAGPEGNSFLISRILQSSVSLFNMIRIMQLLSKALVTTFLRKSLTAYAAFYHTNTATRINLDI